VLRANPSFAWVSYSDDGGVHRRLSLGARRVPDQPQPDRRRKTRLDAKDLVLTGWRLFRHDDDSKYDPRTRPFFTLAQQAGHGVWTPPYVFAGQNVPGVTYALPVTRSGSFVGVLTIDFDLARLSQLVRSLSPSSHGRVVILGDDNTVIAHPTAALATSGATPQLFSVEQIADPELQAARRADLSGGSFDLRGEPFLATSIAAPLPGGGNWRVLVLAPLSCGSPEARRVVARSRSACSCSRSRSRGRSPGGCQETADLARQGQALVKLTTHRSAGQAHAVPRDRHDEQRARTHEVRTARSRVTYRAISCAQCSRRATRPLSSGCAT
jgi:hypothetical protein